MRGSVRASLALSTPIPQSVGKWVEGELGRGRRDPRAAAKDAGTNLLPVLAAGLVTAVGHGPATRAKPATGRRGALQGSVAGAIAALSGATLLSTV